MLALRWTVASVLPDVADVKSARTTGSFYTLATNESVELQKTIAEIAKGNEEVNLKLVLLA